MRTRRGENTSSGLSRVPSNISFMDRLEESLSSVCNDSQIHALFRDKSSELFLPDKICEIVEHAIDDERSEKLESLATEHRIFERVFGKSVLKKLSKIDPDSDKAREILFPRADSAIAEVLVLKSTLKQMKGQMELMKRLITEDFQMAKETVATLVTASVANVHESQVNRTQYLKRITDAHHRFYDIDIPRIRNRYETEIAEHSQNEDKLEKELRIAQKKIIRLNRENQKMDETVRSLRRRLLEVEGSAEELNDTRTRTQVVEGKNSALEKELRMKRKQIDGYLTEIQNASICESSTQSLLVRARAQIVEKDEEIKQLKVKLGETEDRLAEFANSAALGNASGKILSRRLEQLDTLKRERNEAVKTMSSLSLTVDDLQNTRDKLIVENESLQKEVKQLKSKISAMVITTAERDELNLELSNMKEELKERTLEIEAKDKQLFELNSKVVSQQRLLKTQSQSLKDERTDKTEMTHELTEIRKANHQFQLQNADLNNTIQNMKRGYEQLNNALNKKISELTQSQRKCSVLDAKRKQLDENLASVMNKNRDFEFEVSRLSEEIEFYKNDQRDKLTQIDELNKELSKATQEVVHLREASDKTESEMAKLRESAQGLQRKNRSMAVSIHERDTKIEQLTADSKAQALVLADLQTENKTLADSQEQLQTTLGANRSELKSALSHIEQLKSKQAHLRNELKISQEQTTALKREQQRLTMENQRISDQRERLDDKMRAEGAQAQQQLADIKSEKNTIQSKLDQALFEQKVMENKAKDRETTMQVEIDSKNNEIKKFREELAKEAEETANLRNKYQELLSRVKQVQRKCGSDIDELPKLVENLQDSNDQQERLIRQVRTTFHIREGQDLVQCCDEIQKSVEQLSTQEADLSRALGGSTDLIGDVVALRNKYDTLDRHKKDIESVVPGLDASILEQIVKAKQQLQEKDEKIAAILSEDFTPATIAKIKTQLDDIKGIIPSDVDEKDLVACVEKIAENHRNLRECEKLIPPEFRGELSGALNQLVKRHNDMTNLETATAGLLEGKDIHAKVAELMNRNQVLEEIKEVMGTVSRQEMEDIKTTLADSTSLFNSVYSIIVGAPFTVSFPLSAPVKEKLINAIRDFRNLCNRNKEFIDALMARAKSMGYIGTEYSPALDYIIHTVVEEEKQKALEIMHAELSDMRALSERERSAFERNKEKMNKKLEDARAQVADIQARMFQREEEVIGEIEQERQKARASENDLIKELSIREELIRVIEHHPVDMELLRTRLSAHEIEAIMKAMNQ